MKKRNRTIEKRIVTLLAISIFIIFGLAFALAQSVPLEAPPEIYQEPQHTGASVEYLYPNAQLNPWTQGAWKDEYCNKTGMDFLVELMPDACSPAVVRSDLLEEQDVPVFCRMTAIKINPIIQVPYIKKIIPAVENKSAEILDVTFLPARYALSYYAPPEQKRPGFEGTPTMSNLGYVWIHLKRQPVEEKMPDRVVANMSVKIVYDVARTYGINEHQFVLPLLEEEEWRAKYKNYGFWRGKGYLRLQEISGLNNAKIAIYSNPNQAPYAIRELRVGVVPSEKEEIPLPGFYCGAGVTLKLDEISVPKNRVRLLVNGDELLVGEGELIQDSGCVVYSISPSKYSYGGSAIIRCGASEKKVLTLKDFKVILEVDGKEREVSSGSEIVVEKDDKKKYLYVGFLGREYSKEGLEDALIIFTSKNPEEKLSEKAIKTINEAIYQYILGQRGKDIANMPSLTLNQELKAEVEKRDKNTAKQLGEFYLIQRRASREIAGINVAIKEVSGPEQAHYSDEVEKIYKEAIQEYRDMAYAYSTKQHPEGMYYGVIALHEAADLAAQMHKKVDQVDLLRELIDKYSDYEEPEIVAEVEEAREELRRTIARAGDNSVTFSRPNGNYFMQLISIEKPSLTMLSADLEVDEEFGTYGLGDEIGGWEITEIKEDSILLQNRTGHSRSVVVGSHDYFDEHKVKLLGTTIKKEAKVTVLPFERERETITNFSVVIGIEKRAIQLSPDKTKEYISKLNSTIQKLEDVRDRLGNVVSIWKKACYVGAGALWAKNFVTGLSGEAAARKLVMKTWSNVCADPDYRSKIGAVSISDCYRKNESSIEKDIDLMKASLNKANSFVKAIKSKEGVMTSGGLFGLGRSVDEEKFIDTAQKEFPSELSRIGKIYQQKELRKITLADGAIIFGGEEYANINALISDIGAQEFERRKNEYAEIKNNYVDTNVVVNNIGFLHDKNALFKEDIKDLYSNLELYRLCKSKSQKEIESSALCKEVLRGTYGKLSGYSQVISEGIPAEALRDVLGINAVIVPGEYKAIKAPIYSVKDFASKLPSEIGSQTDKKFAYFYHAGSYYIAIVSSEGEGRFAIKELYGIKEEGNQIRIVEIESKDGRRKAIWTEQSTPTLTEKLAELKFSHIEEVDITLCNNNEIKSPYRGEIKFWETGPYKGFVALMPIDKRNGWYMATTYTGLEGALVAWKENADINVFWICNVGPDGVPNFDHSQGPTGDDCCTQVALVTGAEYDIPPLSPAGSREIVELAKRCARNAISEYAQGKRKIDTRGCGEFTLGKPPSAVPAMQCEDFMSPSDCRVMFNLCDPVMCPASRCNFGGKMPVDNVIGSGIIGSLMLCWPNFEDGRGVLVPICLTGVHAGLDNFISILKSGRDCLQEQLESGKTIGICDEIMSIYICEFFWQQFDPFIRAGLPALTESLTTRGGGEYALFSESWKQSMDSIRYFTDYYGVTSLQAFKARSTAQIGTEICKRYTSLVYPTQAKFWEELAKPESPTQAMAWFDETPMGGPSPESHYKVFYHIWAGRDQGVYYSVYLRSPGAAGYYQPPPQYFVPNAFGYLPAGQYISMTPDFRAPSGYKEICIRLNEKEICGFGQATTNFAIEELQNYYIEQQTKSDIKTSKECVAGTPTIIPTATLNIQSAVKQALEPAIYKRGVIRVCATLRPGLSTEPERWKRVGYCDSPDVGCWLDTKSVENAVSDLGIEEKIMTDAENKDIAYIIGKEGFDPVEKSQAEISEKELKIFEIKRKVTEFVEKVNSLSLSEFREQKKGLEEELRKIDKEEIQPLVTELRETAKKCARSDEKARAEWSIAQLLGARARLYSQLYVYEIEKALASCPGVWLTQEECNTKGGTVQKGEFIDQEEGKVCCVLPEKITEQYTAPQSMKQAKIVIDPGHGGQKPGATVGNVKEKDINLAIALELKRLLEKQGVAVIMTRTKDEEPSGGRAVLAETNNADMFLSIHSNYVDDKATKGTEVWILCSNCEEPVSLGRGDEVGAGYKKCDYEDCKDKDKSKRFGRSKRLAELASGEVSKVLGKNLGVKLFAKPFELLETLEDKDIPAILIETGYMSNGDDLAILTNSRKQTEIAIAIYNAIAEYYGEQEIQTGDVKCEIYTLGGKDECSKHFGCWWDSIENKCKNCPKECGEMIWKDRWFGGFMSWIPALIDVIKGEEFRIITYRGIFKTNDDCEKNNCGLDCVWDETEEKVEKKCVPISVIAIKKVTGISTESDIKKLTELKRWLEENKGKISSQIGGDKVDGWLMVIDERIRQLAPAINVQEVYIAASVNNGPLEFENKLVGPEDEVKLCAVLRDNQRNLYSNEAYSGNSIQAFPGAEAVEIKWFRIKPKLVPTRKDITKTRAYRIMGFEENNVEYWDYIQYEHEKIGEGWCINADSEEGTYWYRAEVTIGSSTYYSLGKPADSLGGFTNPGIGNYSNYESTLLEPRAIEGSVGVSQEVRRISRMSNYVDTTCKENGYDENDKRCRFISIIESFKNVPFAYGPTYYQRQDRTRGHASRNYIAIDCLNLAIAALEQTTGKTYKYNDFNKFIEANEIYKLNGVTEIEKMSMDQILGSNIPFNDPNRADSVKIGDVLLLFLEGKYTHTLVLYNDTNRNKVLDGDDRAVCVSGTCHLASGGKLCFNELRGLLSEEQYTIIKMKDLDSTA